MGCKVSRAKPNIIEPQRKEENRRSVLNAISTNSTPNEIQGISKSHDCDQGGNIPLSHIDKASVSIIDSESRIIPHLFDKERDEHTSLFKDSPGMLSEGRFLKTRSPGKFRRAVDIRDFTRMRSQGPPINRLYFGRKVINPSILHKIPSKKQTEPPDRASSRNIKTIRGSEKDYKSTDRFFKPKKILPLIKNQIPSHNQTNKYEPSLSLLMSSGTKFNQLRLNQYSKRISTFSKPFVSNSKPPIAKVTSSNHTKSFTVGKPVSRFSSTTMHCNFKSPSLLQGARTGMSKVKIPSRPRLDVSSESESGESSSDLNSLKNLANLSDSDVESDNLPEVNNNTLRRNTVVFNNLPPETTLFKKQIEEILKSNPLFKHSLIGDNSHDDAGTHYVNNYRVICRIGVGSFSVVKRVRNCQDQKEYVRCL